MYCSSSNRPEKHASYVGQFYIILRAMSKNQSENSFFSNHCFHTNYCQVVSHNFAFYHLIINDTKSACYIHCNAAQYLGLFSRLLCCTLISFFTSYDATKDCLGLSKRNTTEKDLKNKQNLELI